MAADELPLKFEQRTGAVTCARNSNLSPRTCEPRISDGPEMETLGRASAALRTVAATNVVSPMTFVTFTPKRYEVSARSNDCARNNDALPGFVGVGARDGALVGASVGALVGAFVGPSVNSLSPSEGAADGASVGAAVGASVGVVVRRIHTNLLLSSAPSMSLLPLKPTFSSTHTDPSLVSSYLKPTQKLSDAVLF
jgi:hypothetical protein